MKYPEECIEEFESILNKLATELVLAQEGSDQGLVPMYALLKDAISNFPEGSAIWQGIHNVMMSLEEILDDAQILDRSTIDYLSDFTNWGHAVIEQDGENADDFLPYKHHYFRGLNDVLDKIIVEVSNAKADEDTGMIPIYAIINDFLDSCTDSEHPVSKAMTYIANMISDLLDRAKPFDKDALHTLSTFTKWGLATMEDIKHNHPVSDFISQEEEPAQTSADPLSPTSMQEPVPMQNSSPEADSGEPEEKLIIAADSDMEILQEFHTEALEHLEQIESSLITLENDPSDEEGINAIFRSFHTIKGVAGFLALMPIQKLAHHIESLLDLVRSKKLTLTSSMITLVLESKDTLSLLVDQITECIQNGTQPSEIVPIMHLIKQAEQAARGEEIKRTTPTKVMETSHEEEALFENDDSPHDPVMVQKNDSLTTAPFSANKGDKSAPKIQSTIRVNTDKVDQLMDMVGELVIVQSQIQEGMRSALGHQQDNILQRNMNQLSRICKDLQNNSMALRMIPIKPTFQKMHRLARDLSKRFEKPVNFVLSGEDTELDRNMVEQIGDPLVHMVRNAIDHGLEKPEDRAKTHKPAEGNVSLSAYYRDNFIVIELKDDGAGMNPEKLRAKAIEKGLIDANQEFTEEECYQFVFLPGFSTAAVLSDVSGRGVGMDVVKRNITDLRGSIDIESKLGKGTTFYIKLPLTTAIIDGLLVKTGEERFILPTTSVRLSFRPTQEQVSIIKGKQEIINHRGKSIPVVRLHQVLNIPTEKTKLNEGIVVLIENGGKPFGLFVDDMVNKQEVVIKNLGSLLQSLRGISGGAILGDGRVALILDPVEIARLAWQPTLAKAG